MQIIIIKGIIYRQIRISPDSQRAWKSEQQGEPYSRKRVRRQWSPFVAARRVCVHHGFVHHDEASLEMMIKLAIQSVWCGDIPDAPVPPDPARNSPGKTVLFLWSSLNFVESGQFSRDTKSWIHTRTMISFFWKILITHKYFH